MKTELEQDTWMSVVRYGMQLFLAGWIVTVVMVCFPSCQMKFKDPIQTEQTEVSQ